MPFVATLSGGEVEVLVPQAGDNAVKFFRFAPLAPLCFALAGCPSASDQFFFRPGDLDKASNARVTYLRMSNDKGAATITTPGEIRPGAGPANISADGTKASFALTAGNELSSQENLARNSSFPSAEAYGDQQDSIVVQRTPGLNEENDTFLTYHEQKTSTPAVHVTELARGYAGTRSDASVITALRNQANHSATYNGTGSAYVGQGDYAFFVDGSLQMTARFAGPNAGISGNIAQTTPFDPATNPNGVDRVTFTGQFIDNSPDYSIANIKLNATGAASTDNPDGQIADIKNGGGVGSFFGAHAQGTMGSFAGTGETTNDPKGSSHSPVNVIGSFQGTTTDNP